MLDFKEEVSKYKPILSAEEVEEAVSGDDVKDIMDLFTHLIKQIISLRPGRPV